MDHGSIQGLGDDDHSQYTLHSLADAENDFLVASGNDAFVKKTLAEVGAILEGDLDHDNLQGIVANEHLDWTGSVGTIHTDNYIEGGAGTDTTAIHDNVDGEVNAVADKASPGGYDLILVEDSAASWAKKKVEVGKLGVWGVGSYDQSTATTLGTVADNKATTYIAVGTIAVENNSGGTLSKGDICYISGDDGGVPEVTLADADAVATGSLELVVISDATIETANSGYAKREGLITGLSGFTANTVQYLSETAGETVETPPSDPGDIVRVIGYSRLTTELMFMPDNTWVKVT